MDASMWRDVGDRPQGMDPAGDDYDGSAGGLGGTGRSARIGEAGDGIGVTREGDRWAGADDQRDEVGRRAVGKRHVPAPELQSGQHVLFVVEADAGRLVEVADLGQAERQRDGHQREQQRDASRTRGSGSAAPHGPISNTWIEREAQGSTGYFTTG
jgi:hypothetical protein